MEFLTFNSYASSQSCCIDALLQVGHTVSAFDLSAQFLHPRGLLEALDLADTEVASVTSLGLGLQTRFRELIRRHATLKGTEEVPLATYCMQWLEAKGRPIAALEIGKLAPDQLNIFLEVITFSHLISCSTSILYYSSIV